MCVLGILGLFIYNQSYMTEEEYIILYEKRAKGTCSGSELSRLEAFEKFQLTHENWDWDESMGEKETVKQQLLQRIEQSLRSSVGKRTQWSVWSSAAAAIILLAIGFIWYTKEPAINRGQKERHNDVASGYDKARLTLGNGATMELNGKERGSLLKDSYLEVLSAADGQLIYRFNDAVDMEEENWSTLETPKGGQYQLQLPDGSKVWLNASSSLRFSNEFNRNERIVELQGEAYFEVSKSSKPFRVMAGGTEVVVLGTHFNISAYQDDQLTKTTLLAGAVKVIRHGTNRLLKPGEQALVQGEETDISILRVDTEEAVAWHHGLFMFTNEDIRSVMKKIQRWYDVEVVYEKNITNYQLSGSISRYGDIKDVLQMLELTGIVHFKKEGRRIVVMK